jgi:hypothetical protein
MKDSRYNSFFRIHNGLRTVVFETAIQLQQSDLSDPQCNTIEQVEDILSLFESHAHGEDHFFNEPLEEKDSRISNMFLKEHEEDHRLGQVLSDLINQWKNANDHQARSAVGRNLLYAFNEFIAFNLYHMNKEEIELNAVLWAHYSDEEIKATEQALVQQVPPDKMMRYAKWMIRGNNDEELYHWLKEVQLFAPQEVFNGLFKIAQEELPAERFHQLQLKLETQKVA